MGGLSNHTLLVSKDGTELAIADSAAPIRARDGSLSVVVVFRDVTAERRASEGREFLSRATLELNSSLDYSTTLATVARLAVPRIADCCAVDIVDGDAEPRAVRRVAVAHVDPGKVRWVAVIQRRYPARPPSPRSV